MEFVLSEFCARLTIVGAATKNRSLVGSAGEGIG